MDDKQRHAAGMTIRRQILGDAYVDRAVADTTDATAEIQDLITRYAWGEIWTRPGLDHRTRRVLVIGTQIALRQWDQYRIHVRAALVEGGFTADDVNEIVLQQAIYCGAPAALTAITIAPRVAGRDRGTVMTSDGAPTSAPAGAPASRPASSHTGAPASRPALPTAPGLIGAAALTGFILILPSPEGLPPEAHRLAALFAGVLVLWATEALPIAVTALLALALQPLFGLTSLVTGRPPTPGAIFGAAAANFMSSVFFFVLVMFAIAHAWVKTGLARRFALWLIARAGTDATRAVYVFMIGTGAISMVVSDVPAAAIFMAIAVGILDKLGLRPGSRFGRAVMIGIPIAALIGGVGTPAGSSINLLGLIMIEQAGGDRVPFLHWMAIGIPMVAILLPVAAWVLVRFFPPEIASIGDLEEIHDERRRMGPVSRAEWKVVAIMSAMITLWIASTWLPVFDTFLVAVVGAVAMFLPGIGLFTWKEVQRVTGWDTPDGHRRRHVARPGVVADRSRHLVG